MCDQASNEKNIKSNRNQFGVFGVTIFRPRPNNDFESLFVAKKVLKAQGFEKQKKNVKRCCCLLHSVKRI